MKFDIPTDSVEDILKIIGDPIGREVLRYLNKNDGGFFNELSRVLTENEKGSRRSIYGRLMEMEELGIIIPSMEKMQYGETNIKRWVKRYRIANEHKAWISKVLSN